MSSHGGVKKGLFENSATGQGLESLYTSEGQGIEKTLAPTLETQLTNPQGYSPTEMAQQRTANMQSAGGGNSSAVGGALLRAMRTRNAGSVAPAVDAANRNTGEDLSQRNAELDTRNANLKQTQRSQAASGLERLYGTDVGAGENALGLSSGALNDAGNLKNFWQDAILQMMSNAQKAATAGAGGA